MRTMAYGPSKLCGTESTVWAVDGTSAIGIRPIRIMATEGHGRCKRLTIESYVAYLRTATEEIEIRSLRAKIMFLMGLTMRTRRRIQDQC